MKKANWILLALGALTSIGSAYAQVTAAGFSRIKKITGPEEAAYYFISVESNGAGLFRFQECKVSEPTRCYPVGLQRGYNEAEIRAKNHFLGSTVFNTVLKQTLSGALATALGNPLMGGMIASPAVKSLMTEQSVPDVAKILTHKSENELYVEDPHQLALDLDNFLRTNPRPQASTGSESSLYHFPFITTVLEKFGSEQPKFTTSAQEVLSRTDALVGPAQ